MTTLEPVLASSKWWRMLPTSSAPMSLDTLNTKVGTVDSDYSIISHAVSYLDSVFHHCGFIRSEHCWYMIEALGRIEDKHV